MIALIILGLLLALVGLAGCILPVVPGPPISFLALIILSFARNWEPFSSTFLLMMAGFMVLVTVLDYLAPAVGARKYGASRLGVWFSIVGIVIGLLFFPPWGMFTGALVGALVGELLVGKEGKEVLRAGWGIVVGNIAGIGLKLAFSGIVLFYYVKGMF